MNTLFAKQARLPGGWARDVAIGIDASGTVASVDDCVSAPRDAEVVATLVPGMPNAHSHAFQRVLAGRAEQAGPGADSFWTWRERMYACVEHIGTAELSALATYLYIEMLKAGYTSVGEFHYFHGAGPGAKKPDPAANSVELMSAAAAAGIRLTLLPTLYLHGGFGGVPSGSQQRRFLMTVDGYLELLNTLRGRVAQNQSVGVAFHSLRAVSLDAMTRVLEHDGVADGPVHIHAAEQIREVEDCTTWSGQRPIEWLLDHASVDRRWCIVHATHMREGETRALAASGAVVGLCPTTEANLGDGLFPLKDYLDAGGRIAIGSDSHVSVDPWEELRWLEYGQRLQLRERNVAATAEQPNTGARLFFAALAGGARALGQPVGRIEAQHRADFLVIDEHDPMQAGCVEDERIDSLVFARGSNPVTDVMVGGRWVVRDRRHPLEDDAAGAFADVRRRLADACNENRG